ncbi:Trypsin [Halomicrobium zhouii]|uniref:Trypsin n=1 Tax=Halomicrobium zhouii TaxID=767519 RepID=A0A1I6M250_9EURY|nr:trypsin-like serine protease [Halomicrobium zhouii]SFS09775.1 Trypsin [Halomicrobium zhouii]
MTRKDDIREKVENGEQGYSGRPFKNKLSCTGRRGFVKTLASLGFSTAAINNLTKESLAQQTEDPESTAALVDSYIHTNHEQVVNNEAPPQREAQYFTMPRDRWAQIQAVHDVQKKLTEEFDSDLITAAVEWESRRNGKSPVVTLERKEIKRTNGEIVSPDVSADEVRSRVPNKAEGKAGQGKFQKSVDNISIRVEENQMTEQSHYEYNYTPVPGGAATETHGIITTPAYSYSDNAYGWVTVGHNVGFDTGVNVYQLGDNYIGSTTRLLGDPDDDAAKDGAFIARDSQSEKYAGYKIAADSPDTFDYNDVYGSVAEDRLKELNSNNTLALGQGIATGRHTGEVEKLVNGTNAGTNSVVQLGWDTDGGDSGGPYFINDNGLVKIIGIHAWGWGQSGRGNAMYYAENKMNISV